MLSKKVKVRIASNKYFHRIPKWKRRMYYHFQGELGLNELHFNSAKHMEGVSGEIYRTTLSTQRDVLVDQSKTWTREDWRKYEEEHRALIVGLITRHQQLYYRTPTVREADGELYRIGFDNVKKMLRDESSEFAPHTSLFDPTPRGVTFIDRERLSKGLTVPKPVIATISNWLGSEDTNIDPALAEQIAENIPNPPLDIYGDQDNYKKVDIDTTPGEDDVQISDEELAERMKRRADLVRSIPTDEKGHVIGYNKTLPKPKGE